MRFKSKFDTDYSNSFNAMHKYRHTKSASAETLNTADSMAM